jgi:NADH dehydrogenase (ubiquinone) 1 alpha subcomplex subunit 9
VLLVTSFFRNFKMKDVNVDGAKRIAKVCKDAGVARLIHLSSLLADANSPSVFLRTKAEGEAALKEVYPASQTIIVRPSVLFGHEDRLLNLIGVFSASPFGYPTVNKGHTKRSPLYVGDLAEALLRLAQKEGDKFGGRTFDLLGDRSYSMQELVQYFAKVTMREHKIVDMPGWAMLAYSRLFPEWRRPVYSRDSIKQLYADEPERVATGHLGFGDLGIERLQALEELSLSFLRGFRPTYAFARP